MSSLTKGGDHSPTFSVVLPTYDRTDLLARAIRSVLAQTYQDFELIVVDDASPDGAREVVESFGNDRIVYLRRERNGGVAATRNTGIRRARGKYISFLDDDDEYLPRFLEETYRRFRDAPDQVGFMACGVEQIDTTRNRIEVTESLPKPPRYKDREQAYLSFLQRIPFTGWFITIRPVCFEVVGLFDEQVRTEQDRDLLFRLVRRFDYDVIPLVLARHYRHPGPHANVYGPKKAAAYEYILQKNVQVLRQHPRLWAAWHYKTGWLHYHSRDRRRGRAFMLRGLRKRPWYLKGWIGLVLYEVSGSWGPRLHQVLSGVLKRAGLS